MSDDNREREEFTGYSRRGFMQFIGMSAGVVGTTLLSPPLLRQLQAETAQEQVPDASAVHVHLLINDRAYELLVEPRWSLLYVLREVIGLTGTKIGCGRGECGSCTVLIDSIPRYACMTLAVEAQGAAITTVEGLLDGEELGAVQQAFLEKDAFQCGYCTSGQIMAVEGLLRKNPEPETEEIRHGCSGNLCRCGAYQNIFAAAASAAQKKKERG